MRSPRAFAPRGRAGRCEGKTGSISAGIISENASSSETRGERLGVGDAARRILGAMRADEPVFSHREVRKFGGTRDGARLTTARQLLRVNALLCTYSTRVTAMSWPISTTMAAASPVTQPMCGGADDRDDVKTAEKRFASICRQIGICFANHSLPFWRLRLRLLSQRPPSVKNGCGAN